MSEGSEAEIDRRDGESDLVTFERIGKPDPRFRVEQVGDDPDLRYRYHWDDRSDPTPEQFERVGHLEVKLVTMLNELDGEAEDAGDAAHEALVELRNAMMDQRDLDEEQRQEVAMGNLEGLPEVHRYVK